MTWHKYVGMLIIVTGVYIMLTVNNMNLTSPDGFLFEQLFVSTVHNTKTNMTQSKSRVVVVDNAPTWNMFVEK